MSKASRSYQSAVGQTATTLATDWPSSSQTWTRTRVVSSATLINRYESEKRFGFGSGERE